MMGLPTEPDDVDFIVDGRDTAPESIQETIDLIKAPKSRPEHAEEVREVKRILESLEISTSEFGEPDPGGLLAQWCRTVGDLKRNEIHESVVGNDPEEVR